MRQVVRYPRSQQLAERRFAQRRVLTAPREIGGRQRQSGERGEARTTLRRELVS